jgi:hypothetical protein
MKQSVSYIHIACIAVIVICYVLSATVLKGNTEAQTVLVGAAAWLYGKLGFVPAGAVVERIVQRMPQNEVVRIQSMAPTAPSEDAG